MFKLIQPYILAGLVIVNSKTDSFGKEDDFKMLKVKSLTIKQETQIADKLLMLLSTAYHFLSVSSNATVANVFDFSQIHYDKLATISLNEVQTIEGLNFAKLGKSDSLTHFHMNNIKQLNNPATINFENSSVHHIEMNNCGFSTEFTFTFSPKSCDFTKQIHIEIQNNTKLKKFNFVQLFQLKECKYYIDLSGSTQMDTRLLSIFNATMPISKLFTKPDQLYIVLNDVPINCTCELYSWYTNHKQYIHGVKCPQGKTLGEFGLNCG